MNLSPTNPAGWLLLTLRSRLDNARRSPERGASAIEWVIITAVLVGLAAAIGTIIYNMVEGEADAIEVPDLPGGES